MIMDYAAITSAIKGDAPMCLSMTGYGRKIPTGYRVQIEGSRRWYRVYCHCYSNIGTLYILPRGKRLYAHEYDIQANITQN